MMTAIGARRTIAALLAALLFAAVPLSGVSASEPDRAYWVNRLAELNTKQHEISTELSEVRIDYRRGRRANRGRGEERAKLLDRIAELEGKLATVEQELAAFPEQARQAGALPGWFRGTAPASGAARP
jgi:septal ring factor EnvC (AmiA/AmiB activator)